MFQVKSSASRESSRIFCFVRPHCEHLDVRVEEIREGKFEALIENLMGKPLDEIKELYNHREIEA